LGGAWRTGRIEQRRVARDLYHDGGGVAHEVLESRWEDRDGGQSEELDPFEKP
jgi:hypothetical protein